MSRALLDVLRADAAARLQRDGFHASSMVLAMYESPAEITGLLLPLMGDVRLTAATEAALSGLFSAACAAMKAAS